MSLLGASEVSLPPSLTAAICALVLVGCVASHSGDSGVGVDAGPRVTRDGGPDVRRDTGPGLARDTGPAADAGRAYVPPDCESGTYPPSTCGNGVAERGEICFDILTSLEGSFVLGAALVDFDADGKLDIVYYDSGVLHVALGDGAGSFPGSITHGLPLAVGYPSTPIHPIAPFAVGDVTGDGNADVVIGDACCRVVLVPGTGAGFGSEIEHMLPDAPSALAVGDLDGASGLDVAVAFGAGSLGTLLSVGAAGLGTMTPGPTVGVRVSRLRLRRQYAGGNNDAYVTSWFSFTIMRALGDGVARFDTLVDLGSASAEDPTSMGVWGFDFGDFDQDGFEDLVELGDHSVYVRPRRGSGFVASVPPIIPEGIGMPGKGISVGDFDGDALLDVVAGDGPLVVLLGDGAGCLGPGTMLPLAAARDPGLAILIGNVNDDGVDDIVAVGRYGIDVLVSNP